jgi:hypothetical protein
MLLPGNRRPIVPCVCLAQTERKYSFPFIVFTLLRGVFTGRRIETAVLLLLPVFFAVRMFMDILLLLQKRPMCHNPQSSFLVQSWSSAMIKFHTRISIDSLVITTKTKLTLAPLPPHKFVRSLCCYYWLEEIIKCVVGVVYNGLKF